MRPSRTASHRDTEPLFSDAGPGAVQLPDVETSTFGNYHGVILRSEIGHVDPDFDEITSADLVAALPALARTSLWRGAAADPAESRA